MAGLAGFSLWRGMDAGAKLLSNINMLLALGLFVLVVVMSFFSGVLSTTLDFVEFFLPLSNWIDRPDQDWLQGWTVFYWAWWSTAWRPAATRTPRRCSACCGWR